MGACATSVDRRQTGLARTDQHTCTIPNAPPCVCDGAPHGPGVTAPPPMVAPMVLIEGSRRLASETS
jgi:hypothetical protein